MIQTFNSGAERVIMNIEWYIIAFLLGMVIMALVAIISGPSRR